MKRRRNKKRRRPYRKLTASRRRAMERSLERSCGYAMLLLAAAAAKAIAFGREQS